MTSSVYDEAGVEGGPRVVVVVELLHNVLVSTAQCKHSLAKSDKADSVMIPLGVGKFCPRVRRSVVECSRNSGNVWILCTNNQDLIGWQDNAAGEVNDHRRRAGLHDAPGLSRMAVTLYSVVALTSTDEEEIFVPSDHARSFSELLGRCWPA